MILRNYLIEVRERLIVALRQTLSDAVQPQVYATLHISCNALVLPKTP
jgi:hypothetical protein